MRSKIIFAAAAAVCVSCVHSKEVDRRADQPAEAQAAQQKKGQPGAEPLTEASTKKKAPTTAKEEQDEANTRPPAEEGRPELSTSADAMLLPDGARLIQEALAQRGYLSSDHKTGQLDSQTSAALRQFQADKEVARTGYPDRETVRKLGLSIPKVFKATGHNEENPERRR